MDSLGIAVLTFFIIALVYAAITIYLMVINLPKPGVPPPAQPITIFLSFLIYIKMGDDNKKPIQG